MNEQNNVYPLHEPRDGEPFDSRRSALLDCELVAIGLLDLGQKEERREEEGDGDEHPF